MLPVHPPLGHPAAQVGPVGPPVLDALHKLRVRIGRELGLYRAQLDAQVRELRLVALYFVSSVFAEGGDYVSTTKKKIFD